MLNSEPEIQYVALRNIDLIVQKHSGVLEKDVKVFFCKYNDPIYVKLEKLEIMIKLVSERNIDTVLSEFKEYATEVDVEFVRKSVRAIGRCAIKLERAAQRCINTLLELIETKVNYVVQEAIIVIKDIFRKFPNKYEAIIGTLCQNLETLDEPEAKASMIWIIGEYADRIENATELIGLFIDTFHDEATQVQLQLLTATVKLFLRRPTEAQDLVKKVLNMSTDESDNPDLRDRGYIYWRLLSSNVQAAKNVILAEKPTITEDSSALSKQLLDELMPHIGTLSSVYQKPPELFVPEYKKKTKAVTPLAEKEDDEDGGEVEQVDLAVAPAQEDTMDDILGLGDAKPTQTTTQPTKPAPPKQQDSGLLDMDDFLGGGNTAPAPKPVAATAPVKKNLLLPAAKGNGLAIYGAVVRKQGQILYDLTLENQGTVALNGFAAKFNKNSFGLGAAGPVQARAIAPGDKCDAILPLGYKPEYTDKLANLLQVAVKLNQADGGAPVVYFQDKFPITSLFTEDGRLAQTQFGAGWGKLEQGHMITINASSGNPEVVKGKLESRNVFFVSSTNNAGQANLYFSGKMPYRDATVTVLVEVVVFNGSNTVQVNTKATNKEFVPLFEEDVTSILQ